MKLKFRMELKPMKFKFKFKVSFKTLHITENFGTQNRFRFTKNNTNGSSNAKV